MPLWGAGLDEDSLEFESENGSVTGSDIDFGIHDNILLNSTDGAPETDAGGRIMLEDDSQSGDGSKDHIQMETNRSGSQMNFYFTIAGSDGAGELTVARQQFGSMGSSTVKDYGISTVSASQDITQQVSDAVTTAQVNMS